MLIVGAKGFAKEVFEILYNKNPDQKIAFFDDMSSDTCKLIYNKFLIIPSLIEAQEYMEKNGNSFVLGLGNPVARRLMTEKMKSIGGDLLTVISKRASIGGFLVSIGNGCTIMDGAIVSTNCTIGTGCLIYFNSVVTHDCVIGDFTQVSPGATILGRCKIGANCLIGSNSTILPDIQIGRNVIVAAGAVVTKNVPDNVMVAGVPATIKKRL